MPEKLPREAMNLNRLVYFAAVVDTGSFTRAAGRLGITKTVVSQQVARLEQDLGATLLLRTTRRVHPTEAGRALHAHALVILRESAAAFDELSLAASSPQGTLSVTAPLDYGTSLVLPVLAEFTHRHPDCDVALTLSDKILDVHGIDLAIRVGWLRDSSHTSRRIGVFEQWLVCAPRLARELSRIRSPEDLAELPFVANSSLPEPLVWRFSHGDRGQRTVRARARLSIDANPGVHAATLAGVGASVLPDYLVARHVAAGQLMRVLPEWKLRSGGIHAVFPAARFRPAKVSRFVELLLESEAARRTGTS
jgi:DNA-binding transcriptional LysR family regulator